MVICTCIKYCLKSYFCWWTSSCDIYFKTKCVWLLAENMNTTITQHYDSTCCTLLPNIFPVGCRNNAISFAKILCSILQIDAKRALLRHVFVDASCILLVTCGCDTAGSRASFFSSKKASSSWYKHHWTILESTPSHLSHCNSLFLNLVQTWGVKMCTTAAVSLDTCPIWPQMRVLWAVWFVYKCISVWGERWWRPSFISYGDQIFDIIWCDMMIQAHLWDGPVWKMWWQSKQKTRLSTDIWEGEGDIVHVREREKWGENDHGVREMRGAGERMTGRVMPLKGMKMRKIVREN